MEPHDHLAHLRADGEALARVADAGSLEASVPGCPGWDLGALVGHTGRIHRWAAAMLRSRAVERGIRLRDDEIPRGAAVVPWYRAGLVELLDALAEAGPHAMVWNWFDGAPAPARFWFRRMAQETTVHRWDAQRAAGEPAPIDALLAADGIDELLETFVPHRGLAGAIEDAGKTIHLHATDAELAGGRGEWLLTLGTDAIALEHGHAKGDVAVRGTASNLLLLLWNRSEPSALEVFGDGELLQRWSNAVKI